MNHQADPPSATPSLADQVREILREAAAPLTFADLKKEVVKLYPKGTKKAPQPPKPSDEEIQRELDAAVNDRAVFEHPPLTGNKKRYATTPPPSADDIVLGMVTAKLETGDGPFTEAELATRPRTLSRPEFNQALANVINDLKAKGQLHEHPPRGRVKQYGKSAPPPPPSPVEVVAGLVNAKLESGSGPFTEAELATRPRTLSRPEFNQALANVIDDLKAKGELHEHPPRGRVKQYGKSAPPPPPPPETIVREQVQAKLATGDGPFTEAELARKPASLTRPEFNELLGSIINDLKAKGQLYEHPKRGRAKQYGKTAPPPIPWYQTETYAKPFDAVVKAARKVMAPGEVSIAQVLDALRLQFSGVTTVAEPTPTAIVVTPPPPPPPPTDLRTAMKEAYDHLCLFVEFRDKLVELPRLYHETVKRKPDVTVEEFHRELWEMNEGRRIELHVLNEVHSAKEPELAIHRNDSLYYYARWK